MAKETSDVEQAERLGRRRARMLPMLALIFLLQQMSFFSQPPADRAVDHVRVGAWVILSLVILLALNSRGFWFQPKAVRELIDDDVTRANRASAMHWGFVATVLASIAVYVVEGVTHFNAREVIHLIVSAGVVAALIRFGMLERRAHRD